MNKPSNKKLFLLDAMALIYRAYFAMSRNPLINSKGMNVSAISGFTSTLKELLDNEQPSHIAVVFDSMEPTAREETYADYKANRQEMPEDISESIPVIKEIVRAFHIPILEEAGYEADDVIGTLAKKAEQDGYDVYMVTPDKDFAQLVSDNIYMYKPAYMKNPRKILGLDEIKKEWNIQDPNQVIDILGMWGDTVDNIPGIPGIGEKTAKKLIGEYGSLEGVLDHVDQLKGKQQENVKNYADQARLSKQLATIMDDAPVEVDEEELVCSEPDRDKLAELFAELEFRSLGKRILGEEFNVNRQTQMNLFEGEEDHQNVVKPEDAGGKHIHNTEHDYRLVDTQEKRQQLIEELMKAGEVCFDTETTSVDANNCSLVGLSFSMKAHTGYYIPLPDNEEEARTILEEFRPFFESETILKIGQNIKFDILVLRWQGFVIKEPLFDTLIAHYLLEPEMRHNMTILAESYLGYTPEPIENLIGKKGKHQGNMKDVPIDEVKEYATEDADITLQLKQKFAPLLEEDEKMNKLFRNVEMPLIHVLADMEYKGVNIDKEFLSNYAQELDQAIQSIKKEVYELAGESFNLDSPKQLGAILFEKLAIPYKGRKTKTGQYSTSEEKLADLATDYKIAEKILDYRELHKLKSTYVDALPKLINPKDNRIHTTFNQAVAATGRLSSNNPNLQNIPIRTEKGRKIRKAFIPQDSQHTLLAADYSQIELRLVAEISEDEAMLEAFQNDIDIHSATASRIYGVDFDDVDQEMRRSAKTVNFGIIYGISAYGLSQRLGVSREEASKMIDQYFEKYPGIKAYMDRSIEDARKQGYVETLLGRKRYLKDINSRNATVRGYAERNAINTPIQGTAADMIKIAMNNIYKRLKMAGVSSNMTMQVHDELVFDARKDEVDDLKPMIIEEMKKPLSLKVPVVVEIDTGDNWLEAH